VVQSDIRFSEPLPLKHWLLIVFKCVYVCVYTHFCLIQRTAGFQVKRQREPELQRKTKSSQTLLS
jgi:hypothetical protein